MIAKHINNVFEDSELEEESNVQILHISRPDRPVKFYSLAVIVSHQSAIEKAHREYEVYKKHLVSQLSEVEKDFIRQIETTEKAEKEITCPAS